MKVKIKSKKRKAPPTPPSPPPADPVATITGPPVVTVVPKLGPSVAVVKLTPIDAPKAKPTSPVRPLPRPHPISFPTSCISRVISEKLTALRGDLQRRDCPECLESFFNHTLLTRHVRRQHLLVAVCECGYRSRSRDNVTRHQRRQPDRGHSGPAMVSFDREREFVANNCRPKSNSMRPLTTTLTRTIQTSVRDHHRQRSAATHAPATVSAPIPTATDSGVQMEAEIKQLKDRVSALEATINKIRASLA